MSIVIDRQSSVVKNQCVRIRTNTAQLETRMATGRHGKLGDSNAGVDNIDDYKRAFLLYCVANGLEDADNRKQSS